MDMPMELIVGTCRVVPQSIEWIDGGLVANVNGTGFLSLLDATFGADNAVELRGGRAGQHLRSMVVTEITMQGRSTYVTLQDTGLRPVVN